MEKLYSLTDEQFALIEPILREERDARGRKPKTSDRHALEGILYILREGCRWRAMPEAFGHWMMVFMRYKRWVERGVWWKMLMRLQKVGVIQVRVTFMDSSVIRAHRHAAGARKKGAAKL
jgi:putative transposase